MVERSEGDPGLPSLRLQCIELRRERFETYILDGAASAGRLNRCSHFPRLLYRLPIGVAKNPNPNGASKSEKYSPGLQESH